jgi:hypothetical protein
MPVRDSTEWRHAIINRKVINMDHDGDKHVMCAWDVCENDGLENIQVRINYGTAANPHIVKHVFCSEGHKDYFTRSHVPGQYGMHSAGNRRTIL